LNIPPYHWELTEHPVDVWTVSLTGARPALLSPDEQARAARFKFEKDRFRWIQARTSLRQILSTYAQTGPLQLTFTYGQHGKPSLAGFPQIQFNLSHAGEFALLAVTRDVPVGIDIERMRPNLDMAPLLKRLGEEDLPETQPDLYQRWTLREAKSKAAGGALFDAPGNNISAIPLPAPEGYSAAVALMNYVPTPVAQALVPAVPGNPL
jgi:4'-phosphopantetheinyl transferase